MNTILHNSGYIINKSILDYKKIKLIKKELTVEPFTINNNFYSDKKFKVYLENNKQLCLPKYYGIKHFGSAEINDISEGLDINVKFNGELRDYQKIIMNEFYNKFLKTKVGYFVFLRKR